MDFSRVKKINIPSILPVEYQQVEYIRSTSYTHNANYINTGIYPTNNTSLEIDFIRPKDITYSYDRFYGSSNLFRNELNYYNFKGLWNNSTTTFRGYTLINDKRHIIKQDKNKLYIDGVLRYTFPQASFADANELRLFSATTGDRDGILTLFNAKVWEDNILVRNFIPCYRKSDMKIGLFDLVNNLFHQAEGNVEFEKGLDANSAIKTIEANQQIIYDKYSLPPEYQKVEYIQTTTGREYINTNLIPNITDEFLFKAQAKDSGNNSRAYLLYAQDGNIMKGFVYVSSLLDYFSGISTSYKYYEYCAPSTNLWDLWNDYPEYASVFNSNKLNLIEPEEQPTVPYYLFCGNGNNQPITAGKLLRVWYAQIPNRLNLVPCYRKSDGVIGMYDLERNICPLTGTPFFINAGTGEFEKGPDVT